MMLNDDDNVGTSVRRIELLWRDKKSESPIAERLFDPTLINVKEVVEMVFLNGGFVRFRMSPDEFGLLATLSMDAEPGYFRMTALLNGLEGSKEFMEWVDGISGKEPVVILDHPWESQTICYDVATALDIFGRVLNDVCIPVNQLPEFSLS